MPPTRMKIAKLDEASLVKLKALEQEMGTVILALEQVHPLAQLTPDQVQRLQTLEQELGAILIAYRAEKP